MSAPHPACVPYAEDAALIERAVREAGAIAKAAFKRTDGKTWDKSKGHPVTDTDIAVNDHLEAVLRPARPGYGWLSEETQDDASRHACPRTFVVDPIDGTRAFIDRRPGFAVSVAVIENGQAVAGAVFNPMRDQMFTAHLGGGARLNGESVRVGGVAEIAGCRMVGYPRKFRRQGWPDMDISISNSMAYRMVMVAGGLADATVSFTPKSDWDVAAADIIAREAGAVVTNLDGVPFRYDAQSVREFGVVVANPALHGLLLERTRGIRARVESSRDPRREFGHLGTRMADRGDSTHSPEGLGELLHIVIGGELDDPNRVKFRDVSKVDFVGAFGNFADAQKAWRAAAQATVDNAHMRYFILHAHQLLDPSGDGVIGT